jgi:hypothetical protein
MTNAHRIAPPERTYSGHLDMVAEQYLMERDEARSELREARAELRWACDGNRAAVEVIRKLMLDRDRYRKINVKLRDELRRLRDEVTHQQNLTTNPEPPDGARDNDTRPSLPC